MSKDHSWKLVHARIYLNIHIIPPSFSNNDTVSSGISLSLPCLYACLRKLKWGFEAASHMVKKNMDKRFLDLTSSYVILTINTNESWPSKKGLPISIFLSVSVLCSLCILQYGIRAGMIPQGRPRIMNIL